LDKPIQVAAMQANASIEASSRLARNCSNSIAARHPWVMGGLDTIPRSSLQSQSSTDSSHIGSSKRDNSVSSSIPGPVIRSRRKPVIHPDHLGSSSGCSAIRPLLQRGMMLNHIVRTLIPISALLAGAPEGAFAHGAAQSDRLPAPSWVSESGTASYYGAAYQGRRSASGIRYDQMDLTAAHSWLPFGTKVKVTLTGTGRSVLVTITDRLYSTRRIVDLSFAAASQLGMIRSGIAHVTLLPG
jgi:rare lipoprotein A